MPTINFGNITNVGGKNVSLGSQSGFDIEGLVNSLVAAKRLPAVNYEKTITQNDSKIVALNSMKAKLEDLKSRLNALRNPVGLTSASANVFDSRTAFMTMSTGDTATNYLGVTTANGAQIGNYDVEVTRLARNDKYSTNITFTSRTDSVVQADGGGVATLFEAGNLVLNGTNISLEEGDSLNDIISQINSAKATTGVSASILKIDDTTYQLVLTSTSTGNDNAITLDDTGVRPGVGTLFAQETLGNLDSEIEFNGETITRSSNAVTDLIDNVTFNLYQETAGATIKLAIDKNSATVASGIADFLTAYNAIRQFNAEQTATDDDGNYLETAVLNNSSTLRTIVDRMASYVNGQASGIINPFSDSSVAPLTLGDLGISFADVPEINDGETIAPEIKSALDLDVATLSTNIEAYFEEVRKIFEFQFTATSGDLDILDRNNTVPTSEFTIDFSGGIATLTHIDDIALTTPVALTVTGSAGAYTITGPNGTDLAELSFIHTGGNETISYVTSEIEKKFTLDVDSGRAAGLEAQITKLFGQTLSTAINLEYDESDSSSIIRGTGAFEGLDMLYTGDGTDVIGVSFGQGIADKMYNALEEMLDEASGVLDAEIDGLTDSNTSLQDSVDRIDAQIVTYRDQLLEKFSALEAAISSANQLLMLLDAQSAARDQS